MKAKFYISMYSGMQNPEMELDEESSDKIQNLAVQLDKPFHGAYLQGLAGNASNHYAVHFGEGPVIYLTAQPYGYVHLWKGNDEGIKVEDTNGLWAFLNAIGGYVLQKHHAEIIEAMKSNIQMPKWTDDLFFNIPPLDIY